MNSRQLRDLIMQHERKVKFYNALLFANELNSKSDLAPMVSVALNQMIESRDNLIAAFDKVVK